VRPKSNKERSRSVSQGFLKFRGETIVNNIVRHIEKKLFANGHPGRKYKVFKFLGKKKKPRVGFEPATL
jgi:hypothetical protein